MTSPYRFLATACILATAIVSASAKIDRDVEKTFQVQPGVRIKVSTQGGDISVSTTDGSTVKVVAKEHIKAGSEGEADDVLKKLDLNIEQNGNEVTASASYPNNFGFHINWPPVQVDFEVSVPKNASADLKTSGGDVTVEDLDGKLDARTSGGDIKIGSVGGNIDASTSGGNVVLGEGRGNVRLGTSGGNIEAKRLVGPTVLRTSGGDIKIGSVENTIDAQTSGGNVKAEFVGDIKGDSVLSTSGGQVKAAVAKGVGYHLDASTSGGEVDADGLTITIDRGGRGKSELSGKVNGGGPELKLRSSGGDIEVETR
jgi:DUF4097 and DUF4098 domain-containing protein YvlB